MQAEYTSLNTLLKNSDFVSIHVPLNKATHHLIGSKQLNLMKKTAILINTARGAVIDEKALVQALQNKKSSQPDWMYLSLNQNQANNF